MKSAKKEDNPESRKKSETSIAASASKAFFQKRKLQTERRRGQQTRPTPALVGPLGEVEAATQKVAEELFPSCV